MAETPTTESDLPDDARCPRCDSVVAAGDAVCRMCGRLLGEPVDEGPAEMDAPVVPTAVAPTTEPPAIVTTQVRERRSSITTWMTLVAFLVTAYLGLVIVQNSGPVNVALFPTLTPLPPTPTYTPTLTPLPTQTAAPTETPTITPTPAPTMTPLPPRFATVAPGETLIGWALRYNVSVDSIIGLNDLGESGLVQAGQLLQIPYPTATPPLLPVEVEINGQMIIADPVGCERYTIQEGDALFAVAGRYNVPMPALLAANRMDEQAVIRPGDTICIPEISYDDVLPPTPGPSPTPSPTGLPPAPYPLYPLPEARFDGVDDVVTLQWLAVKDLAADEWYMVEVVDVSADGRPRRAFTRENAFRLPVSWRPVEPEAHRFRWRVSIVRVQDFRSDGVPIYTYGGAASESSPFVWQGFEPTATPTVTPTAVP